jgi:DNA-3-methyladenine glycosylase
VEAYLSEGDPAAHCFRGPTPRNRVLYGAGGHAYVYLIYGMHYCLNVSAERAGRAGCVLIRGLENIPGPGRVTRALAITLDHYGADLTRGPLRILDGAPPGAIEATPRIGIAKAADLPLRFVSNDRGAFARRPS